MTNDQIFNLSTKVPGWMWDEEIAFLIETASAFTNKITWVEIGTHIGKSLLAVGLSLPTNSTLFSVDISWGEATKEGQTAHNTVRNLISRRPDLKVIMCKCDSFEASEFLQDKSADVVFIDGDHSYEVVRKDIELWKHKVKPDGLLLGHDYHENHPGVIKAVNERFNTLVHGSIWEVIGEKGNKQLELRL